MAKTVATKSDTLKPLETARLTLAPDTPADVLLVRRLMQDPAVIWWRKDNPISNAEIDTFLEHAVALAAKGLGWWLVYLKGMPQGAATLLGHVGLQPLRTRPGTIELAYHFLPSARGHGFASEAAAAVLAYGFNDLKLEEIAAIILPENAPSQAVARRLGLPRAGTHVHADLDHDLFILTRKEYAERTRA